MAPVGWTKPAKPEEEVCLTALVPAAAVVSVGAIDGVEMEVVGVGTPLVKGAAVADEAPRKTGFCVEAE